MLLAKGLISVVLWCVVKSELVLQPNETVTCSKYSCLAASPECSCDPLCSVFGDCCLDAKNVSFSAKRPLECSTISDKSVYMISACDDGYPSDAKTRQKCDNDIPIQKNPDPYDSVPVTSIDTQITYKNVHCARCNGDTNVVHWNMDVALEYSRDNYGHYTADAYDNVTETFLANNLAYFKEETSWGVRLWIDGSHTFVPVVISATEPAKVTPRGCGMGFIGSCPPNWMDSRIASMCELFSESLSDCYSVYKNNFCALCHGVAREELRCGSLGRSLPMGGQVPLPIVISLNTASAKRTCMSKGEHLDVFKNCKTNTFEKDHPDVQIF